jgi:UDP-N-acetylmuramate dehydrogenase
VSLTPQQIHDINGIVQGRTLRDVPLNRFTSFRIGGPAVVVAEPGDVARLAELLRYLADEQIPRVILGAGTNVLFSDEGFDGVVVRTGAIGGIEVQANGSGHPRIVVGAGVSLAQVVSRAAKVGATGLEDLWGIPGSFGGAVTSNAGAGTTSIADRLVHVDLLTTQGEEMTLTREHLHYGYRFLRLPAGCVVARATLELTVGDLDTIQARLDAARARRKGKQPVDRPSAGCVFKNPSPTNPAGAIIDRLGCKGMAVGDAQVSEVHANFIINRGTARAKDVLQLIEQIRTIVMENERIALELEIRVIGRAGADD